MPHAVLTCRSEVRDDAEAIEYIAKSITHLVATNLSCSDEGGQLTEDDVEVEVKPIGPLDVNNLDVILSVTASELPARKANLQNRADELAASFRTLLGATGFRNMHVGVWVKLVPAAWSEFTLPTPEEPGYR